MTPTAVPDRVRWAVDLLDPDPAATVLEIGGGPGVAAGLVCDRLTTGRLVMIDRSAVAVARTSRRDVDHLAAGRLEVHQVALAELAVPPGTFDQAFAVDVNLFWVGDCDRELAVLRTALRPGGDLHVVYGGSGPTPPARIVEAVSTALRAAGFAAVGVRTGDAAFAVTGRAAERQPDARGGPDRA